MRQAWMPGDDTNWAMRMVSGLGLPAAVSQEVVRPFSYFALTFDIAFENPNFLSTVQVFLGNLLLGSVSADGTNTRSFQFVSHMGIGSMELAGLLPGEFVDLTFRFTSLDANNAYIDNVFFIPTGSTTTLLVALGVLAARRRRA